MTNREWLNSLTDEELAEIQHDHDMWIGCKCCAFDRGDYNCRLTSCEQGTINWLKAKHKEKGNDTASD